MNDVQAEVEAVEVEAEVEVEVAVSPEEAEEAIFKANAFTPQEAAQELGGVAAGWTGKRLRRYIRGGDCPARKIQGRWYCTVENLEHLLGVLEAKATAKAAREAAEAAEVEKEAAEAALVEPEVVPGPVPDEPF